MSQSVGFAPVKKNPRVRVRINTPQGVTLTSVVYDNPTIMYTKESLESFIASWPISEPTEVCWDVPTNWRLSGTITKVSDATGVTRQGRFSCGKIHVYQDGDGLRMLMLTDIREMEEPIMRPTVKVKGAAGRKTPGFNAQKSKAARAEAVSAPQSAEETPNAERPDPPQ